MSRNAILVVALAVMGITGALAQPPRKIHRLRLLTTSQPMTTWRHATMVAMRADALITFSDAAGHFHRQRLADLAFQHRLAMMTPFQETTSAGGLISYGPSILELVRHSAVFIDRILKGTKAGDIAIEQPTKFDLVINLKTAKALGLTVPQSLLLRADEVIE